MRYYYPTALRIFAMDMETDHNSDTMSRSRGLVTDTEWERITGEADVEDSKRYQAISRVRRRIKEELPKEMEMLEEHHPDLFEDLRETVCGEDIADTSCPECEGRVVSYQRPLSDEEYTTVMPCLDCDFEIETESNLAAEAREERLRERTDTER